jgi:hypothetical protein
MLALLGLAVPVVTSFHVEEDHFVEAGKTVVLRGVEVPTLESSNQGQNVFRSCRVAIEDWHANAIRLPVSQDRWLDKAPGQKPRNSDYRDDADAVIHFVTNEGGYLLLELASSDAGKLGANLGQHPMPDANSETFWKDVAWRYRKNPHVIFGLYRHPTPASAAIWQDGGQVQDGDLSYASVGFAALLQDIRKQGAKNVVVLAGPAVRGLPDDGYGIAFQGSSGPPGVALIEDSAAVDLGALDRDGRSWIVGCMNPAVPPSLILDWAYKPSPLGATVRAALNRSLGPTATP